MKIIAYNINSCTQEKIDWLLNQKADFYVVPEIAANVKLLPEYEMEYLGNINSKGLGVIWRKGNGKIPDWYKDKDDYKKLSYAIPLIYNNVLILGIWPTNYKKNKTYTELTKEIIEKYKPHFSEFKQCIITGDFNLYHKKDAPNKAADILEIHKLLSDLNFKSAYHEKEKVEPGNEPQKTFYMRFKKNDPFFLDYTYTKLPVKYDFIESPIEKFSDHIGQVIELY